VNLTFLQTFLTVLETGNLNKAAERLNVTQSTVTARLNALEDTLGCELLLRSRKGTRMTRAGFELRPHAELLVNGWAQARKAINLPEGYSGLFSFACEFDLWHDAGRAWLYAVRAANPGLALEARPGRRAEIAAWLGTGITDAAMTHEPISAPGLASRICVQQEIVQVASRRAAKSGWDPKYVYVDLGTDFRRQHASAFPNAKTASITFSTSSWALEHILKFGGSGYLPKDLIEPHLEKKSLWLVKDAPVFRRTLYLVWREVGEVLFPWLKDDDFARA
jgi:DNA-binding transcriptional LysR family regulator